MISVSDSWGRTLSYVYDINKRITTLTDPGNGTYAFGYDSAGNLASITFPDTQVRQFLYNEQQHTQNTALPNSLTGIIDENGNRFATYEYDTQGRVVTTEHAGGAQRYTLAYTTPNALTTVTDMFGVARDYGLTKLLGMVKSTHRLERESNELRLRPHAESGNLTHRRADLIRRQHAGNPNDHHRLAYTVPFADSGGRAAAHHYERL